MRKWYESAFSFILAYGVIGFHMPSLMILIMIIEILFMWRSFGYRRNVIYRITNKIDCPSLPSKIFTPIWFIVFITIAIIIFLSNNGYLVTDIGFFLPIICGIMQSIEFANRLIIESFIKSHAQID